MKQGFKRILVAVRNIEGFSRSALGKIAVLAQGAGATVELFHAITEPELLETVWRDRSGRPEDAVSKTIVTKTCRRLERLGRSVALANVKVTTHANWDSPAHEAIVRRVLAVRADLLVIEAARYGPELRPFLRHTDWQLIRHCPCPVLLIRTPGRYDHAKVLAAIDPIHATDAAGNLDRRLLEAGNKFALSVRGELHACQVYLPIATGAPSSVSRPTRSPRGVELQPKASLKAAFERLASRGGIAPRRRHLRPGRVSLELDRITRRLRARVLVMGALSRSSGTREFIGDTAERILDSVSCDVLAVKLAGFRTTVGKHTSLDPAPSSSSRKEHLGSGGTA